MKKLIIPRERAHGQRFEEPAGVVVASVRGGIGSSRLSFSFDYNENLLETLSRSLMKCDVI
jgi:hypothetical protein